MTMEPMDVGPKYGGHLQITEVDRQQALSLIDAAQAQGYLSVDEYEHRAVAIRSATLYDDLRPVTRDLGNVTYTPVVVPSPAASPATVAGTPSSELRVGFFSGSSLTGRWTAPSHLHLVAVFGGVEIDLTDAVWTSDEIVVDAYAVFGGIDLKVPDGVEVVDHTIAIFGGTSVKRASAQPLGRRVVVKGLAMFGGIDVKGPKPPKG
jgi:hypothetical protein